MKSWFILLAILLLTCFRLAPASGDSVFETARLKSVAANPPGVSLTLSLPGGRMQFHQGEIIPLTAAFASHLPKAYRLNTDPGSRDLAWNSDAFQVDAPTGATDPLRVYYDHEFGVSYNGPGPGFQPLAAHPVTIPYTLNEWLRFDAPGRYRVYLTSGRVVAAGKRHEDFFFQGRAMASNAVDLEILPDDPAWADRTLQQALPLFNAGDEDAHKRDARQAAVRTVRFLGTPDAARAMVARYGRLTEYDSWNSAAYYQTRLGLFGFPQPALVIQEMERRIAAPEFPVFSFFLNDLAQTQFLAAYPQPVPPFVAHDPARDKQRQTAFRRRFDALAALTEQGRKELAAAFPAKRGKARAVSLYTLFAMDDRHGDTAAHRGLARALVPVFDQLPPEEQTYLLDDDDWREMRGPAMLPPLRRLYAHPQTKEAYGAVSMRSLALRRLAELSPAEGRTLLLAEIRSAHPRVEDTILCSLPERTLPALNRVLAANLERSLNGEDGEVQSRLVERYATRAILPRVKAMYQGSSVTSDCAIESNLLAYFLRTDHAYGLKQMRKVLASRKDTGCCRFVLSNVTALAPGPDVERLAVAHLHDPDTQVESDAVKTLGTYGSRAAEAPLWARMREWRRQWLGKAGQIEPTDNPVAVSWQLEYALTQALATAPGWLLDQAKLQALEALCVTRSAHGNVAEFLRGWAAPISITFGGERDQWSVVQYGQLPSLAALENKLTQFPHGTRFRLSSVNFPGRMQQAQSFGRLKPFLEKRGMRLEEEPLPPAAPADFSGSRK